MNETTDKKGLGVGWRVVLILLAAVLLLFGWNYVRSYIIVYPEIKYVARMSCTENLSQIREACYAYALEHNGSFPDTFHSLVDYDVTETVFLCKGRVRDPGPIESVDSWTDYVLVTNVHTSSVPDRVVAYCKPEHHRNMKGAAVLFSDGSIHWFTPEEFEIVPCDIVNHSRKSKEPQQTH